LILDRQQISQKLPGYERSADEMIDDLLGIQFT